MADNLHAGRGSRKGDKGWGRETNREGGEAWVDVADSLDAGAGAQVARQVSVMLTMATVMGPSAPTVFSFLHMQAPQHAIAPSAAPACLLLRSLCTP